MTVNQLIKSLETYPPETLVLTYNETGEDFAECSTTKLVLTPEDLPYAKYLKPNIEGGAVLISGGCAMD